MASARTSRFRRFLHWATPFLFRHCPEDNFHWRWSKVCFCCSGTNGMGILVRLGERWWDAKRETYVPVPHWSH